jgi:hypothetical protein
MRSVMVESLVLHCLSSHRNEDRAQGCTVTKAPYTLSVKQRFYCVTSYLTEKLSKLRSFDRQYRSPHNYTFQSSFTQITAHFTQRIPQFPQFTCRHHDGIISRHSNSTSVSSNSFSRWTSHDIFLFKYHFLLHILRLLLFFSDNIMADVASKQQTTALFLSTIVTRTRRHTEMKKKNWQTWWETCAVPENIQFRFSRSFYFTQLNCTV